VAKKDKLTIDRSLADFRSAYRAKSKLVKREKEDFLFALGDQWRSEDVQKLDLAGVRPMTDNRIAPNLFLLTGLERQNRTDFKAFPEGEEDGLKAEVASVLLKDAIKKSGFTYKSSEQFKDGITAGESHLELFLDFTESLINGKPQWAKCDGDCLFPDPTSREYDFSDARYVYKFTKNVELEDLVNLYPDSEKVIREAGHGRFDLDAALELSGTHRQPKDYPTEQNPSSSTDEENTREGFDLIERYYKKWVKHIFVGDMKTGELNEVKSREDAEAFISEYQAGIVSDQAAYQEAITQDPNTPIPSPDQDPERFRIIERQVPEMWCFAHTPGVPKPLSDKRAWFYPKWKTYPFVPYFARFSTAPLKGDERHLLIQGLVHGVKGAQEKHNKAEMLMIRHLNSATNSGWIAEEGAWIDESKVQQFGAAPGVNLTYKRGMKKPERIFPMPLSDAHRIISAESAESIKAQLGINADLLATQDSGRASGRAIALRQRQGLLMVQELFDNLTRSRVIAGRFLLTQLGEIYDTETAFRVLGEQFLQKNFPPLQILNEQTGQPEPMQDPATGQPMPFDKEMAVTVLEDVLAGDLERYDVAVGEAVASESQKLANAAEVREVAQMFPGAIPPDVLIRNSQLPEATKTEILNALQQAQAAQAQAAQGAAPPQGKSPTEAAI